MRSRSWHVSLGLRMHNANIDDEPLEGMYLGCDIHVKHRLSASIPDPLTPSSNNKLAERRAPSITSSHADVVGRTSTESHARTGYFHVRLKFG